MPVLNIQITITSLLTKAIKFTSTATVYALYSERICIICSVVVCLHGGTPKKQNGKVKCICPDGVWGHVCQYGLYV